MALIAPSGPYLADDTEPGKALLKAAGWGWRELADPSEADGFLAATDTVRAERLVQAFVDPDVDAVWVLRGGYGCLRLLPRLDWEVLRAHPKPLLGMSDLTALLNAAVERAGLPAFHGPVVRSVPRLDETSRHDLAQWLEHGTTPLQHRVEWLAGGTVEGRLMGGNLATLVSLVGTPWMPDLKGAILLLEDVNEAPYRVDRMLQTLLQAGILKDIKGVVMGEFLDEDQPADLRIDLIRDLALDLGFTLVSGAPCGHGSINSVFPFGAPATLDRRHFLMELPPAAPQARPG
jgi:muramoyltetrapeptide carboxypeptidase